MEKYPSNNGFILLETIMIFVISSLLLPNIINYQILLFKKLYEVNKVKSRLLVCENELESLISNNNKSNISDFIDIRSNNNRLFISCPITKNKQLELVIKQNNLGN